MAEDIKFEDEMGEWLRRRPFLPFTILVSSGDRIEISEGTQVAVGANVVEVVHPRAGVTVLRRNQLIGLHSAQ